MTGIISDNVLRASGLIKAPAVAGGAWTFLSTATPTGTTVEFTSWATGYDVYKLIIAGFHANVDGAQMSMVVSTDGGSTWETGNIYWVIKNVARGNSDSVTIDPGGYWESGMNTAIWFTTALGGETNEVFNGELTMFAPQNGTYYKCFRMVGAHTVNAGGAAGFSDSASSANIATAIDGLKFAQNGVGVFSGRWTLYGIKHS